VILKIFRLNLCKPICTLICTPAEDQLINLSLSLHPTGKNLIHSFGGNCHMLKNTAWKSMTTVFYLAFF